MYQYQGISFPAALETVVPTLDGWAFCAIQDEISTYR